MTTIEPIPGSNIYDVLSEAVAKAPCRFKFNDWTFETRAGETLGDARQRFKDEHGFEVKTNEQCAEDASKGLGEMQAAQATAIAAAKVMTEAEMRDAKAPWPKSPEELLAYIRSLVDRPHDYGTCVYAMSLAAVAAYQYVAGALGTTGFQAGCADLDIVRRTRGWEWGKILDYSNLLLPQYCNTQHFPSLNTLLNDNEIRGKLREMAKAKLAEQEHAHPNVIAHWKRLVSNEVIHLC